MSTLRSDTSLLCSKEKDDGLCSFMYIYSEFLFGDGDSMYNSVATILNYENADADAGYN